MIKNVKLSAVCLIICMIAVAQISASEDIPNPQTTSVDTLLYENFNGAEGPFVLNPLPGWTVLDYGVPEWDETSWSRYVNTPYPQYWNGDLARVFFDGPGAIADWLITPSLDCGGETTVILNFKQSHSNSSSNPDTAFVFGSIDGGQTWPYAIVIYDYSIGSLNHPDTATFDISSWAAGSNDVKIAFCLKGSYVLTWYIDEPFVSGNVTDTLLYEDFNGTWGPFGNNPPNGWTIINEITPEPPNANDWSRWYYSTWPDTVALAYDNMNSQTADEWLITPTLSFSESAICSLSYYHSYWDHSTDFSDSATILGSTDGGITWDHVVAVYTNADDRSIHKSESWRGFDISSWVQNQNDVKIGFHYTKDIPSYLGWWFFDDLAIYETVTGGDNVAALSFDSPNDFIVTNRDYYSQATVQNLGLGQQTISLNLVVTDPSNVEVYNQTETDILLDSLQISQVTFTVPFIPAVAGNHTFTAVVINPGDQDPSDDTVQVTLMAFEHNGTGGPDAYGYSYIDNTDPSGPVFNWIDITSTGTQVNPGSHYFMSGEIPLGFSIRFYGTYYSTIWINSHGELHLGSRDSWLSTNDCPLPDYSTPHAPLLAVFWDRLYIHYEMGHGVYYQYFDEPENDYFVVQWQAKLYNDYSDSLIFEAILYENGDIIYQYNYVSNLPGGQGQEATVGIEYDVISSGLSYLCNDDNPGNRLQAGLAIKWFYGTTDVSEDVVSIPEQFSLGQNYPNPFNARTTISYGLPENLPVKIEIFDILGRHVEILIDAVQPAGYYQVNWNAKENNSGIYFYNIKAGDFAKTRKMILMK